VPPGNASYSSVDGVLFDIGMTTLIQCPAGKAGSYTLPSGVTSIAGWAFHSCGRLTSVTLPATLVAIGSEAFTHCTGLTSISIPDSVTSIDYSAFSYCSGLARVLIGTGVTSIGAHGLAYCPALKGVYFRGNAPVWGGFIFDVSPLVVVYYMPTSSGWEGTFGLRPTAPWDGNLYLLTVNGGTGGGSYPGGDQVAIAAGPAPGGQVFDRWTGATQHVAAVTSAGTTVTMPAESISVTATYKVIDDASYTYTTNNGAVTITKYTGTGSVVSIPAVINNLPVTSIGVSAFQGSASLTGVTLPASVTTIGDMAFYNCANLANVVIGAGVSSIGTNVFLSCPALGTITVNAANPFFSSMDGVLFNAGRTTLIQYPPGKTGSYAIPAGITTIGSRAFHRCTGLSSVTLPDSVIGIGDTAFANCSALTDVMIGNGITTIGSMAFYFCQALTSVTIPDSTTSIGPEAFSWCSGLTSVYIGAGVASLGTFQNCPSLGTITVAAANGSFCSVDGVLFDAGRTALIQCPAGKTGSYTIPAGVSNIGRMAFASCAGLARITLPDGLTGIEAWAFDSCTSLTGLTLPGSITSIGDGVFYACTALTGVYFEGNAPPVLGWGLFNGGANATVYYMLGATGWPAVPGLWAERPTALWSKGSAITHNGTTLTMNFVDIGHAGNATDPRVPADPLNTARYGAVSDAYQIGKFEVTADQWDAVIAADPNVGNARSTSLPWSGTMPAAGITWFEAAKFCNWLTCGNAYSGAYQFSGGTLTGVDRAAALATYATVYVLPTEDEWYKAAYFKAAGSGYTLYPSGDTQPSAGPSGENYLMSGAAWDVGSGIAENNGTYDMGGNLWEWTESASDGTLDDMAERRELRGGHFDDSSDAYLRADRRIRAEPTYEDDYIVGFRVAAILAPPPPYTYTTSNGKITITKYTGPGGVVAIPATIDGKPVTSIAGWAFSDCASLTGVTIPDSVTSMGDAFFGCGNLTFITVADANPAYGSLNGVLFDKNRQTLLQYPGGKIGGYAIPAGVTSIGTGAFYGCAALSGITFPDSVITIGYFAFAACTQLPSMTIPDTVINIHDLAFDACASLTSVTIGTGAINIGGSAFGNCANLTSIAVAAGNPAYSSLDGVLFDKNRQTLLQYPGGRTGTYVIPAGVTSIDGYAFYNCARLTGVTLPAGVISLGLCAFYECTALTGVTIPDSVTSIGESAYKGCSLLTSASFMGNAPTMSTKVFDSTASGFTVYYLNGKAGFTAPLWNGYPALEMDAYSPLATWLLANGLPPDANPQADPNSDGVSLLLAYALNLDPKRNLSASMPQPVMSANQMSLTFYAGSAGVSYTVESSSDLHTWSAAGVTLGALDANKLRTATVATSGRSRFLRLVVRY
jgi:hypothetical protein